MILKPEDVLVPIEFREHQNFKRDNSLEAKSW